MSTISPNRLRKIKEQLNNGKSHYGQWTWSLDITWMDDELMMDWLIVCCFPLLYLLTYLCVGKSPENLPHSIFPEKLLPYSWYTPVKLIQFYHSLIAVILHFSLFYSARLWHWMAYQQKDNSRCPPQIHAWESSKNCVSQLTQKNSHLQHAFLCIFKYLFIILCPSQAKIAINIVVFVCLSTLSVKHFEDDVNL